MAKGKRFVNPTDKARKEARKKELKKNKKQRQLVRSAVIEKKDPTQIIADLEKLDQLEYDALLGSAISDSLYKDKRKKLKETWERVLKHYLKEDPDKHQELKKLESDYEASHVKKMRQYEAIKAAQEVKLEDIPLPPDPDGCQSDDDDADEDPSMPIPDYIVYSSRESGPPGCPPGVPPNLKDIVARFNKPTQPALVTIPKLNNVLIRPKSALLPTPPSEPMLQKAAIIESKPVIFRPKVTKFVPSAVRKKQATMDH